MFKINENNLQITQSEETTPKSTLTDVFYIILRGDIQDLEGIDMKQILSDDLSINLTELKLHVANVLEEAILYYLQSWPGWERRTDYINGKLQFVDWCGDLKQFLTFKCNDVIKNAETYIAQAQDVTTQTDDGVNTNSSNSYSLQVDGPPAILNTIAFYINNDDVCIRFDSRKAWRKLDLIELLNWPFVSVEVLLPDIHLLRANSHKIDRYLTVLHQKHSNLNIERIDYISEPLNGAKAYSYKFFRSYFLQFIYLVLDIPGVDENRVKELHTIFNQFLGDIGQMNIAKASMCTNTTVRFHIGDHTYSRQKITSDETQSVEAKKIIFCENITPQVECGLRYFNAEQDMTDTSNTSFKSLNAYKKDLHRPCDSISHLLYIINNSCLKYSCTFCKTTFASPQALAQLEYHFLENHKNEQNVVCNKCDKLFEIHFLAGQRWNHACN